MISLRFLALISLDTTTYSARIFLRDFIEETYSYIPFRAIAILSNSFSLYFLPTPIIAALGENCLSSRIALIIVFMFLWPTVGSPSVIITRFMLDTLVVFMKNSIFSFIF